MVDHNAIRTSEIENNDYENEEDQFRGEADIFAPEVDTIVRLLLETA